MGKRDFPQYRCHKVVRAMKIERVDVIPGPRNTVGTDIAILYPQDPLFSVIEVSAEFNRKHRPTAGCYLVIYDDGYESISPAEAFESGYSKVEAAA